MGRRRKINGRRVNRSPILKDGDSQSVWTKPLDYVQTAGDFVGMLPGVGNVVDLVNTGISTARTGYALSKGDNEAAKTHGTSAATRAFQAIPGTQSVTAGKLVNKAITAYDTIDSAKMLSKDANQAISKYKDFKNKKNNKITSADAKAKTVS